MTVDQQTTVNAIDARQLYEKLLSDTPIFILDVRNEQDFERWHVEGRANLETLNLPYYDFLEDEEGSIARVSRDREVLVICAKEGSSQYVAELLAENGISASYLSDGITSWGNYYDVRDIANNEYGRIIQIARPARGDLSFAIISENEAILIDPLRNTAFYRNLIDQAGAKLTGIFETHVHADHISGGPALARETGADYYVHPYDAIHPIDMLPARMDYLPLGDGQRFSIGRYEMSVIWYPGHTLGQVNFLLSDPDGKRYLFSGDGIFLRSFGRPDLGGKGETWTPVLYESMYERLPQHIDNETMILPAHFSGLNEDMGEGIFAASYGEVQQRNELIQPRTPEDFYEFVINHLPVFPQEYIEIKRVNIGLSNPTEEQAQELELGKNICALSG